VLPFGALNPSSFCDIQPDEVILYKWGGEILMNSDWLICQEAAERMQDLLAIFNTHGLQDITRKTLKTFNQSTSYKATHGLVVPEDITFKSYN
jgi:hypothetical protein